MRAIPKARFALVLLASAGFLVGLSVGCSENPIAPDLTTPSTPTPDPLQNEPNFVQSPGESNQTYVPIANEFDPETGTGTSEFDGSQGGTLRVGRFTLIIPAGAFDGPATVSLSVPDPEVLICDLQISPATTNNFRVPVTLKVDCAGLVEGEALDDLYILWLDEAKGKWKMQGNTFPDPASSSVHSDLNHFSTYSLVEGRSGW